MIRLFILLIVILFICTGRASAQIVEEEEITHTPQVTYQYRDKSPALAALFSVLLPGGGQYYNGEIGKGIAFTATSVGGYLGGFVFLVAALVPEDGNDLFAGLGLACWVVSIGSHIWSIVDAPISANKINQKNRMLSWDLGDGMNLSLRPDVRISEVYQGHKAFSPSYGTKISFTF